KPLRAFEKPDAGTKPANALRAPIDPVRRLPEKATRASPWARAVCTNASPLWKGPRVIFSRLNDDPKRGRRHGSRTTKRLLPEGVQKPSLGAKYPEGNRWISR